MQGTYDCVQSLVYQDCQIAVSSCPRPLFVPQCEGVSTAPVSLVLFARELGSNAAARFWC